MAHPAVRMRRGAVACRAGRVGQRRGPKAGSGEAATPLKGGTQSRRWDILGIGQGIVDLAAEVDDTVLTRRNLVKGSRTIRSGEWQHWVTGSKVEEGGNPITAATSLAAGGSLSNTLSAVALLGRYSCRQEPISVAMGGPVGSDALGDFFCAEMERTGVSFLSERVPESRTGRVVVLTTPDAQRTLVSDFGTCLQLNCDDERLNTGLLDTGLLLLEGYLWELGHAAPVLREAALAAKRGGSLVALTASDASCVSRHVEEFRGMLPLCDIVFANAGEAILLAGDGACERVVAENLRLGKVIGSEAEAAALALGEQGLTAVVTDGNNGSYIVENGILNVIPPYWTMEPPKDTCGAGDAYAAGVLYAFLRGADASKMGYFGARVASKVIAQVGPRLSAADAAQLVGKSTSAAPSVTSSSRTSSSPSSSAST